MAHDDRWAIKVAYDALEVLDYGGDGEGLDGRGVLAQRLHLDLQAGVGGGENAVTLLLVVPYPLLPTSWGHPQPVDQQDGVGGERIWGVLGCHGSLLRRMSDDVSSRSVTVSRLLIGSSQIMAAPPIG